MTRAFLRSRPFSLRFAVCAIALGLTPFAYACSSIDEPSTNVSQTAEALEAGTVDGGVPQALINEVLTNPMGTDEPFEFIELRGTPNGNLTNYYVVVLEGDNGSAVGTADMVVNLGTACSGACSFGANGLLLIKAVNADGGTGQGFPLPGGSTTTVVEKAMGGAGSGLENGSLSILLVHSTNPILEGTDYDTGNAGTLIGDLDAATLLDSVAWKDGSTDVTYGPVVLSTASDPPDAATRVVGDVTPVSAAAWAFGNMASLDAGNSSGLLYSNGGSPNLPGGALLTPGDVNFAAGATDGGTDAGTDGATEAATDGAADGGSDGAVGTDGGSDATTDSGSDSSVADTGPTDATPNDSSTNNDASTNDGGKTDAGSDASASDSGAKDSGARDAAPAPDSGRDAATSLPAGSTENSSCSCKTVGTRNTSGTPFALAAIAFGALVSRLRKRNR